MQRPRFTRAAVLAATTALFVEAWAAPQGPSLRSSIPTWACARWPAASSPRAMAFIGPNDFLVLEKNTGAVKRVTNGVVQGTVADLSVNFGSERGLLGIALHPGFPMNPGVYLYWTLPEHGGPRR